MAKTDKKNAIMQAALKLFAAQGYVNASPADIAKAAGVAVGGFYVYFNNKLELFTEIARQHFADAASRAESRKNIEELDQIDRNVLIYRLLEMFAETGEPYPGFYREAAALVGTTPELRKILEDHHARMLSATVKALRGYRRWLKVRDLESAALVVNIVARESAHFLSPRPPGEKPSPVVKELIVLLKRYLFLAD